MEWIIIEVFALLLAVIGVIAVMFGNQSHTTAEQALDDQEQEETIREKQNK